MNGSLFTWLTTLYPLWAALDEEAVYLSAYVGIAELLMGGCTTSMDHLYVHPCERLVDAEIRAAHDIGFRLHATRGSMTRSVEDGGLPPRSMTQPEEKVLADSERLVKAHHCRPVEYFESVGWMSDRTWVAHCIHPNDAETRRLAAAGVGVAHCPSSTMLIGGGTAAVQEMRAPGIPVGLGHLRPGALTDPVEAWLRCGPARAWTTVVGGRVLVDGGEPLLPAVGDVLRDHRRVATALQSAARREI